MPTRKAIRHSVNTYPICDFTLEKAWRSIAALQKSRWNHRSYGWKEALSGMVFVPAQKLSGIVWTPIRYVTLHFRESVVQHRCVTEIALKSSFLCVNRRPIRYGFRAGANAIRHSVNTYPICDFTLEKAWRSIAALQKSRWNHRSYAWTEALSGMVFVPALKLSGIVLT